MTHTTLSAALEARDKLEEPLRGIEQYQAWQVAKKATPAALDWIAKALPWVREMRLHVSLDPQHAEIEIAELDALIAQAEGKEVGE